MKNALFILIAVAAGLTMLALLDLARNSTKPVKPQPQPINVSSAVPDVPECYVGKVDIATMGVRLMVLKHCRERVADREATELIQAANLAASKGLNMKDIGNHHVDKDGKVDRLAWGKKMTIDGLRDFLMEQVKVGAEYGDTLVIYTTGHGSSGGSIQILGSRHALGLMFAEVAEKNDQEILWWQSSCHAAAGIPKIEELNEKQQTLFSMITSSSANRVSYWGDQQEPFLKTFVAMAENSAALDPDQNEEITAGELRRFLDTVKGSADDLVFAKSDDEPIFGKNNLANDIPIVGPDGRPIEHPEDYIPIPRIRI